MTQHYQPPETGHEDLERLTKPELAKRLAYELERVSDLRRQCFRLQGELDAALADVARWQAAAEGR